MEVTMKKNKIYIILAILTAVFLFATSALCNQCGIGAEEKLGVEEEEVSEETAEETEVEEEEAVAEETAEETEEEEVVGEEAEEGTEEEEAEEEEGKAAPTIELEIYQDATYSESDSVCYYRIKAIVTGNPSPTVEFSKDDSLGVFGSKKAQVNLYDPSETYTLTATATNSEGSDTDSINLSWGCEEEIEEEEEAEEETAFAVTSVTASVDPPSYTGVCPKEFTWSSIITVNAPGTVTYQWEVEGGSPSPPQNLTFSSAGSKTITKSCHLSCGWPNTTLWRQVRIISPNEMVSNQATETLTCYPDIDVRPLTVNFGEIACHSSAFYGVVIENLSSGKLDINSVNITAGNSFFSIEDDPCTGDSLFKGQQCIIRIKFGPISVCPYSGSIFGGNLRIKTNDPDEGYVNVSLTATQK